MPEPEYDRGYASGVADGARTIISLDVDRLEASAGRLSALHPDAVAAYNEATAILRDAADAVDTRYVENARA